MKKISTLLFSMTLAIGLFAQAPHFPLFEHFSQASCTPCAQQNPGFQTSILNPNPLIVRHITYHTSWPGIDPMYNANTTEVDNRVTYYNITGVPTVVLLGTHKTGGPAAFTQSDVDAEWSQTSPIKISVSSMDNGSTRDVTVTVLQLGNLTAGNYVLRTAIIERNVNYTTAPGSNGELYFPDVFRKMLPNTTGDVVTLPGIGQSVTFNYTYTEDATWDMNEIGLVAFLQNEQTKEVVNSGSDFDPVIDATLDAPSNVVMSGTSGTANDFNFTAGNSSNSSEDFVYTLTTDAPANWTGSFSVGSNNYTNTATITVAPGATNPVSIHVTPGLTPAVAKYTLSISSTLFPNSPPMAMTVYVISNVTDLIVNNSAGLGDGTSGTAAGWQADYLTALQSTGITTYGITDNNVAMRASMDNALTGVRNMYYNVGWTFPCLETNWVNQLQAYMDNGGDLFMAGQDVAWSVFDAASTQGNTVNQNFMNTYMGADYVSDGVTADNNLNAVSTDPVFGTVTSPSALFNYYGGSYFFPDNLSLSGTGIDVFHYNTATKIAGIRNTNGTHKSVFLAPGLEMIQDANTKNLIISLSRQWFEGSLSAPEFDAAMLSLGQNFPNPTSDVTSIPLNNINNNMTLIVNDVMGRIVLNLPVDAKAQSVNLNTLPLTNGIYYYHVSNGTQVSKTYSMQVNR